MSCKKGLKWGSFEVFEHGDNQSIEQQPPDPSVRLTLSVENLTFIRILQFTTEFGDLPILSPNWVGPRYLRALGPSIIRIPIG